MTTKLNLLVVSMVTLGLAGAVSGCEAHAQVGTPAPATPPPPPAPPAPAPVAAAPAPPPPPVFKPPTSVGKAKIEGTHVKIPGELEFDVDKATLKDTAGTKDILNTLVEFMAQNPTVTKLRIEGHTDNTGTPEHNMKLSQERADAVAAWLALHGVDKSRLVTKGYGQTIPLEKNDSAEHKAMNRRTVFHIAELNGAPVPASEANAAAAGVTGPTPTPATTPPATTPPATTPPATTH